MKQLKSSYVCQYASLLLVLAATLITAPMLSASIIFDDFNVSEGHFTSSIASSPTTVGEDPSSTADRVTSEALEGLGGQQLHLIHDATTTAYRVRHLSGAGSPASNIGFAIGASEDGFIGFYVKTTATGWETSINLDGPGNTSGEMRGSTSVPIIADGQWHLYEWDLDAAIWGSVPGIVTQTMGFLPNLTYTIDSIYFRDLDGSPGPTADIYLDFVAKSDSGTVANLVPEPSNVLVLMVGGAFLFQRRRS